MRGTVICIVLALVTVEVLGGSFYGEKENALKAVGDKTEEFMNVVTSLERLLVDEWENTANETEQEVKERLYDELDTQMSEFAEKSYGLGAVAITKGKSLSVFDCLKEAQLGGYYAFLKIGHNILNEINENIKARKQTSLKNVLYNCRIIATSAIVMIDKLVNDINKATSGFEGLKADGIKNIETSIKLLEEMKILIPIPDLRHEFLAVKQEIAPKLQNVTDTYLYKSYQCLLK